MRHTATLALLLAACWLAPAARAGHSRHPYFDGGQSVNGRFVVVPELIEEPAAGKKPGGFHWKYVWKDVKENKVIEGRLEGLRSGKSSVFEPVHGHIFVSPDGETFAVWNPQVMAPTAPTNAAARAWEGFSHRLVVYRKTGEVVRRFDLKDFLKDEDWAWLYCYGRQVYWQTEYPGLTRDNAPRVGYALYRISPDYTVLEVTVGANAEAARKAKEKGVTPPAPRVVRVHLTEARLLRDGEAPAGPEKVPGRPFKGDAINKGGRGGMKDYVPSLDPVRVEGTFNPAGASR
jgi:hypothetical protein